MANTTNDKTRQWSGITKEIWERGEKIDEEGMEKTYKRLMEKKMEQLNKKNAENS